MVNTRFQGSGSNSAPNNQEGENRQLTEEEIGEIMVNAEQGLTTLDPDPSVGVWYVIHTIN